MKTTRHDSFAAYVLPSVLAFALSGLYTIVDGFFIGQSLGDLGLAAITLAYPAAALLQAVTALLTANSYRPSARASASPVRSAAPSCRRAGKNRRRARAFPARCCCCS